jgi:hypothetical protein
VGKTAKEFFMMKRLIFMVGMLMLTLTFANAQSSDSHFQVLSASVEQVKIRVIKDTKLYSIALTAGSQIYEAKLLAFVKDGLRWEIKMPGALKEAAAGAEIIFEEFDAPTDFKLEQIMILTEPEAKPIYLPKP